MKTEFVENLKDKRGLLEQIDKDYREGYEKAKEEIIGKVLKYVNLNLPEGWTLCDYKNGQIVTRDITLLEFKKGLLNTLS